MPDVAAETRSKDQQHVTCSACRQEITKNARKCHHCSEWTKAPKESGLPTFGWLLILVGTFAGIYAFFMSTTVPSSYGDYSSSVNNIGLIKDQQNLLVAAGFVGVIGAILVCAGEVRSLRARPQD
jgi:hypothetical protein